MMAPVTRQDFIDEGLLRPVREHRSLAPIFIPEYYRVLRTDAAGRESAARQIRRPLPDRLATENHWVAELATRSEPMAA